MKTGTTKSAVITHGGVIMALLAAFGLPEAPMHEWLTPSGCGYTIRITPSVWMRGQKFEVIAEIPAFQSEKNFD
jgi:alpha-ribazole phosphatase